MGGLAAGAVLMRIAGWEDKLERRPDGLVRRVEAVEGIRVGIAHGDRVWLRADHGGIGLSFTLDPDQARHLSGLLAGRAEDAAQAGGTAAGHGCGRSNDGGTETVRREPDRLGEAAADGDRTSPSTPEEQRRYDEISWFWARWDAVPVRVKLEAREWLLVYAAGVRQIGKAASMAEARRVGMPVRREKKLQDELRGRSALPTDQQLVQRQPMADLALDLAKRVTGWPDRDASYAPSELALWLLRQAVTEAEA